MLDCCGLWTWPPRLICAPAFNHKFEKFCTSRGVRGQKNKRLDNENVTPWTIAAQKLFNRRANARWPTDWPNHPFVLPVVVLSLQEFLCWKFRNYISRNKALAYLYFTFKPNCYCLIIDLRKLNPCLRELTMWFFVCSLHCMRQHLRLDSKTFIFRYFFEEQMKWRPMMLCVRPHTRRKMQYWELEEMRAFSFFCRKSNVFVPLDFLV